MIKCCSKNQCSARATYTCNCREPSVLFCVAHISDHLRSPGRHITDSLIILLTEDQKIELLPKLLQITEYLQKFQQSILGSTLALIESIQAELLITCRKIEELQQAVVNLIIDKGTDKDNYEIITNFTFEHQMGVIKTVDDIKNSINGLLEIQEKQGRDLMDCNKIIEIQEKHKKDWKDCDEIIFPSTVQFGDLASIDLNTFKFSHLDFTPKIGKCGQVCKLDESTYFFHGGNLNNTIQAQTYLIKTPQSI